MNALDVLLSQLPAQGGLSPVQIAHLIDRLPAIQESRLIQLGEKDSSCPICFTSYLAILAEEELASVMDSPAHPSHYLGVTKLSEPWQCGHMFCRRDISKWIEGGHDSCPLCRRLLLEPTPGQPQRQQPDSGRPEPTMSAVELEAHFNQIIQSLSGSPPGRRHGAIARARGDVQDDEPSHEFSAMYS